MSAAPLLAASGLASAGDSVDLTMCPWSLVNLGGPESTLVFVSQVAEEDGGFLLRGYYDAVQEEGLFVGRAHFFGRLDSDGALMLADFDVCPHPDEIGGTFSLVAQLDGNAIVDGTWYRHCGLCHQGECNAEASVVWSATPDLCAADINGDGFVDLLDLLDLLGDWGPCPVDCPMPCSGSDVDGDGENGISDLLKLLGTWGPCA